MKYRFINGLSTLEVLNDDSLEQRGCNLRIPDAFRIHDDDRPVAAHAETRSLAAFHAPWAEEQIFPLQEVGEQ